MELTFKQEKETKNTVRYQEQSDGDVVIGPLYVQKSALGENPPEELTLWLEIAESEDADPRYRLFHSGAGPPQPASLRAFEESVGDPACQEQSSGFH